MQTSTKNDVLAWSDVFALRHRYDSKKPLHVQVVESSKSVTHVRPGDELFLHEITSDEISLECFEDSSSTTQDFVTSSSNENARGRATPNAYVCDEDDTKLQVLLPKTYGGNFTLLRRYPECHCFLSVQDIINNLPAVSKLIFPMEGIQLDSQSIKPRERLEIEDKIRDSTTATEMLCVRSMKTDSQYCLPGTLKKPFAQLASDCFRCGADGVPAKELALSWKPDGPPFKVKLCQRKFKPASQTLEVSKQGKQKDKRGRKKKLSSSDADDLLKIQDLALDEDDKLIPSIWRDKVLLMKRFQRIRVQNIMMNARDFTLPENAKLTIKILSPTTQPTNERTMELVQKRKMLNAAERYSGTLAKLPIDLINKSREPLLLMVTEGTMSTVLRQQLTICQGCRLLVRYTRRLRKILMTCADSQRFLVSLEYNGTFKRFPANTTSEDLRVDAFLCLQLPCKVQTSIPDKSLGYDQLNRRKVLTATEILSEITLVVENVGADGQVLSEQPFEIPLSRTNLSVDVQDAKSYHFLAGISKVRHLPSVEFVMEEQIRLIKASATIEIAEKETRSPMVSPEFPISPLHLESDRTSSGVRQQDLYSYAEKKNRDNANPDRDPSPAPPPRPPKPPVRPPKSDRMREHAQEFHYRRVLNSNSSNNVNLSFDSEQGSTAVQLREKAQKLREHMQKRATIQDIKTYMKDSNRGTEWRGASLDIPDKSRTLERTKGNRKFPEWRMRPRSFETMHEQFNPALSGITDLLVDIDDFPTDDQPNEETIQNLDIGVYEQTTKPVPADRGLKHGWNRNKLKNKRGVFMSNPNYASKLGDEIQDSALFKRKQFQQLPEEEPIYSFATDVSSKQHVEKLPSFADDYEVLTSPMKDHVEENIYTAMTGTIDFIQPVEEEDELFGNQNQESES